MVSVRLATRRDALAIGRVHVRSWQATYRREIPADFLEALDAVDRAERWATILNDASGATLVAEIASGEIVGFCDVRANRDEDLDSAETAEITALYVDPDAWRSGNGRSLCDAALARAREQGFQCVTLWVLDTNERARRFYEAMGFQPDAARKTEGHPSGVSLPEVRYRLFLAGAP